MSYQIGNTELAVAFVGNATGLQRVLDQSSGSVEQWSRVTATSMRQASTASVLVAEQFSKTGMSAGQLAAATRGLPAQFTDIFTSLQAGQAPLTVFLQQGGQLKDMFGGIGPAARAMGGYVAGLINPFTIAAATIGSVAVAAYKGAAEFEAFNKTLILSGGTAGVTAHRLMDMAAGIDSVAESVTQSRAAAVLDEMVKAGVRGEAQLKRYALAAAEFESAGGGAAEKVAANFEALARDPLAASGKLTQSMGYLTVSTYEQIKALEQQGRVLDAAKVAQDAYASVLEARAPALVQNLGLLERGWRAVASGAAEAWDAMLNVGREQTLSERISEVDRRLAAARGHKTLGAGSGFDLVDPRTSADVALLDSLKEQQRLVGRAADLTAERTQREKDGVAWLQQGERYLSSQSRLETEIAKARQLGIAAGRSDLEIQQRIQVIRANATKSGAAAAKELREAEREAAEQRKRDLGVGELRNKLAQEAWEKETKAANDALGAYVGLIEARQKLAADAQDQLSDAQREAEATGLTTSALARLEAQRLRDRAATLRRRAVVMDDIDFSGAAGAAYREQAKALEDLANLKLNSQSIDDVIEEAAAGQGGRGRAISDGLGQSISDGILSGARKGFAIMEILRNEIKAQFAKTILQPVIQPVAQGFNDLIGAGINGMLGAFGFGVTSSGYNPGAASMGFSTDWEQFMPSAKGNVFAAGPAISAYSSTVVDRPTLFPFAKGIGLMGEAGAEAVMPLRRGADGRLGVSAQGGGGNVTINFINQSGQQLQASQKTRTDGDGSLVVDLVVREAESRIADGVAHRSGPVSRALESGWGLRPAQG